MTRGRFAGTVQIVRFNWPFYVAGLLAIVLGLGLVVLLHSRIFAASIVAALVVIAAFWWAASLATSYWVYDASDVMSFDWIDLGAAASWVNLHAGLDESTLALAKRLGSPLGVFDFFSAKEMTEPSIRRARRLARNPCPAVPVDYRHLPLEDGAVDLAMVVFAAHELREKESREAFFRELHRIIRPVGRLVIVEHLRDLPNFIAFGPGFMHFMPESEWYRLANAAAFSTISAKRRTPFVRAFVLERQ